MRLQEKALTRDGMFLRGPPASAAIPGRAGLILVFLSSLLGLNILEGASNALRSDSTYLNLSCNRHPTRYARPRLHTRRAFDRLLLDFSNAPIVTWLSHNTKHLQRKLRTLRAMCLSCMRLTLASFIFICSDLNFHLLAHTSLYEPSVTHFVGSGGGKRAEGTRIQSASKILCRRFVLALRRLAWTSCNELPMTCFSAHLDSAHFATEVPKPAPYLDCPLKTSLNPTAEAPSTPSAVGSAGNKGAPLDFYIFPFVSPYPMLVEEGFTGKLITESVPVTRRVSTIHLLNISDIYTDVSHPDEVGGIHDFLTDCSC